MTISDSARRPVILITEHDDRAREFLADNLAADQLSVSTAADPRTALEHLGTHPVDLILVDVNGHTLELLDSIRDGDARFGPVAADTPLIALTADGSELHCIRLLDRGADDVITKPYSYPELRSRIHAVLRRAEPRQPRPILRAGPVHIDLRQRTVTVEDRPVELSGTEYALLTKLASDPARVFTRPELTEHLWGCRSLRGRALDTHASRLRTKLRPTRQPLLVNVWGVGYRLLDAASG